MLLCNYSRPRCMLICVFVCLGEEADFILGPGPKKTRGIRIRTKIDIKYENQMAINAHHFLLDTPLKL